MINILEFYNDKINTAKKEYNCEFCNKKINIGERYHRQSGKYDGEFFDRKLHTVCDKIISKYCKEEQEYEDISYDWIYEWLSDKCCYNCPKAEICNISTITCEKILEKFHD